MAQQQQPAYENSKTVYFYLCFPLTFLSAIFFADTFRLNNRKLVTTLGSKHNLNEILFSSSI